MHPFRSVRRIFSRNTRVVFLAASSSRSSSSPENDTNPYSILGVSPMEGFDAIKAAHSRKSRDAKRRGDGVTVSQLDEAYDKIMLSQLSNRKRGVTFGSFKVSKDIKYADRQPLVPWGLRSEKSEKKEIRINMAISAIMCSWVMVMRSAGWRPLQFLGFSFVYRIFEKLKAPEQSVSSQFGDDDDHRMTRMGKRLLRALTLVFSSIALVSLAYTGLLNVIELGGGYIPSLLYHGQEVIVTVLSAIILFTVASYYR